jgi:hypothetical protein
MINNSAAVQPQSLYEINFMNFLFIYVIGYLDEDSSISDFYRII